MKPKLLFSSSNLKNVKGGCCPIFSRVANKPMFLKLRYWVQINWETIEESSIEKLLTPVSFTDWTIARKGVGYTNDDVQVCFAEKQHLFYHNEMFSKVI